MPDIMVNGAASLIRRTGLRSIQILASIFCFHSVVAKGTLAPRLMLKFGTNSLS